MSNELIWFLNIGIQLGVTVLLLKLFGKYGLFAMMIISSVLVNIQTIKTADIFGMTLVLGTISYSSLYLTTDLMSELYGKKSSKLAVLMGFLALFFTMAFMQITLWMTPSATDFAQPALQTIFGLMPRLTAASIIAYLVSQNIDVNLYHFWKKLTNDKYLWLRNNGSTLISQFFDSVIFFHIAFFGTMPYSQLWTLIISTYIFKLIIAVIDTPFMYLGVKLLKDKKPVFKFD